MSPLFDKIAFEDLYGSALDETNDTFARQSRLNPTTTIILNKPFPWIDTRNISFADALTQAGSNNTTILISDTVVISATTTIPTNVDLLFLRGGILSHGSYDITINRQVDAGLYKIFDGTGTVTFGTGSVKEVYPQWWGAIADGSNDDTTAIQAAIDSITKGIVFLIHGWYKTTSALTIDKNDIHIRGAGINATIIEPNTVGQNAFEFGNGTTTRKFNSISDLAIATPAAITKTGGSALYINKVNEFYCERVFIDRQYWGIYILNGGVIHYFDKVEIRNPIPTNGIGMVINHENDIIINNLLIDTDTPTSEPSAGIRIRKTGGFWLSNSDIINSGYGLVIDPQGTDEVYGVFIENTAIDNNDNDGIYINPVATAKVWAGVFINVWTSYNTGHGVNIGSVGTIDGIQFVNHESLANTTGHGFLLDGGINVSIRDSLIAANSSGSSGTYHGISVSAGVSKFNITNNRIGQAIDLASTQGYGILVNTGASDEYTIIGNNTRDNVTGGISDGGTGVDKRVENNLTGDSIDIASAATITLPASGDFFNITGTTNITSVTASWRDRRVVLKFAGILTFTDGSNLKIAGNFVTTADDTITLVTDGTSWFEVSRSAN